MFHDDYMFYVCCFINVGGARTNYGEVGQAADLTIALTHPARGLEAVLKALQLQKLCQDVGSDRTQIRWQCLHQSFLNPQARQCMMLK